mmetsp:Transcript_4850/g.9069  ORF Transcript_4850/g.9069 Transcript_4850/m.9069 type:complete len:378 (+) Transcript_4850:165-1298(+)
MSRLSDLEEPRESSTTRQELRSKTPIFIQLSYKSLLRRQTPVELFCSDASMSNVVKRSWISVPDSENLIWEMEDDRKRYKLSLRKIIGLSHPSTSGIIELEKADATPGLVTNQILKVNTPNKYLYIIFNDPRQCKEWYDALSHSLNRAETPTLRKNLLGNIYDISEIDRNSVRMWREMKVTFVKNDHSSAEEFLVYDTTQENLEDSLSEVLHATADKTDVINSEILKQYLLDVTSLEELKRTKDVRGSVASKAPENLSAYTTVNQIELNQKLFKMIQKAQNSNDGLTQTYRLMLAQKYSLTAKLSTIAAMRRIGKNPMEERKSERVAPYIKKWEKDLSANVAKVRESIIEKQREHVVPNEESRPRSWYREACECRLF